MYNRIKAIQVIQVMPAHLWDAFQFFVLCFTSLAQLFRTRQTCFATWCPSTVTTSLTRVDLTPRLYFRSILQQMYIDDSIHRTIGYYSINFAEPPCYLLLRYFRRSKFLNRKSFTFKHLHHLKTIWKTNTKTGKWCYRNIITYTRQKHKKYKIKI